MHDYLKKEELEKAFNITDFKGSGLFSDEFNIETLIYLSNILEKKHNYTNKFYKTEKILINLFSIQELYIKALTIGLDEEREIELRLYSYQTILEEYEIDFHILVLLAGEDYFKSSYYDNEEEDKNINIIWYLIDLVKYKNVTILTKHFGNNYDLLEVLIKDTEIYDSYIDLKNNIDSIEDLFDNPEIARLSQWTNEGFY